MYPFIDLRDLTPVPCFTRVQTHGVNIAKLWARIPRNKQETCANCGQCVCNLASHLVIESV